MTGQSGTEIRIATYNVNGLNNPIKRAKILSKLKKDKIDIALIQETHLTEIEHSKLKRMGFRHVFSSSYKSGHRRGVATIISGRVNYEPLAEIKDKEGRYVLNRGKIDGVLVTLLNIYAPPGIEWLFYRQIFDLMASETQGILIGGRDLNVRLNPKLDTSRTNLTNPNPIGRKIRSLMSEMGIIDIWRDFNHTCRDYTHFSSPHSVYSRIDYLLTYSKGTELANVKLETWISRITARCICL